MTHNLTKQKTCYYTKNKYGFAWYLTSADSPACKCIMAVAKGETVGMNDLGKLQCEGIISGKEYNAIRAFDNRAGTEDDLTVIKKLRNRVKVKLVLK